MHQDPDEGRGEQDDASVNGNMTIHRDRNKNMSTELERISKLASENRQLQFLSIAHHLTPAALTEAFNSLKKDASAGVDGIRYDEYRKESGRKIQELCQR